MDIASFLIGLQAGQNKAGGGSVQYKSAYVSPSSVATGAFFSVDFGFVPDMIIALSSGGSFSSMSGFSYYGTSTALGELTSIGRGFSRVTSVSGSTIYSDSGGAIEKQSENSKTNDPIYGATANGFYVGSRKPLSGNYYVYGWKFL